MTEFFPRESTNPSAEDEGISLPENDELGRNTSYAVLLSPVIEDLVNRGSFIYDPKSGKASIVYNGCEIVMNVVSSESVTAIWMPDGSTLLIWHVDQNTLSGQSFEL